MQRRWIVHGVLVFAVVAAPALPCQAAAGAARPAAPAHQRIDINSASSSALKTLPGIGEAEAQRIIAARPYPSKAKLVASQVLPMQTYLALKDRIVAVQPTPVMPGPAGNKPTGKS